MDGARLAAVRTSWSRRPYCDIYSLLKPAGQQSSMKMQLMRIIHNYFQVEKDDCVLEQSISVGRGQARGQGLSKPASKLQHAAQLYKFHVERRERSLLFTSRFQYTRLSTKSPPPPKLFLTIVCKSSLQKVGKSALQEQQGFVWSRWDALQVCTHCKSCSEATQATTCCMCAKLIFPAPALLVLVYE